MTHAILRTGFNVKRSKVRVTGRLTQTHKIIIIIIIIIIQHLYSAIMSYADTEALENVPYILPNGKA